MKALQVFAGDRARQQLLERGLRPGDVGLIPGAAGGPKGLILNALDRFIFGHWLPRSTQTVHLVGASIGAWRLACAALDEPEAALVQMAEDYVHQRYEHEPGRHPTAQHVSDVFGAQLRLRFGGRERELLTHPRYRLHVFASHGRGLLHREGRWRTPAGYLGAYAANALSRRALGAWLERVVFSDPREVIPITLGDFATHQVALSATNFAPALLASCSIPFWLKAVYDIPGAPLGAYWDGGITDYHLHLNYASMPDGLVLYPHFQSQLVPGWFDKAWRRRHWATGALSNVVVLAPRSDWVASLPNAKLPDRTDVKTYVGDVDGRIKAWAQALAMGQQLADDFAELVDQSSIAALPLA